MLWIGTPGNQIWGDATDGSEDFIAVIEYPTPEPSSLAMLGIAGVILMSRKKSDRCLIRPKLMKVVLGKDA